MSAHAPTLLPMSATGWADIIAGASVVIALATLVWSRIDVRKAAQAAEAADRRAERATRAAEDASAAQRAIAEAMPKARVEWQVAHLSGSRYQVAQVGELDADDVQIECNDAVRFDVDSAVPSRMRKGDSFEFFAAGSFQTGSPRIELSWIDAAHERRQSWATTV